MARLVSTHIRHNELSKLTEQQLVIQLLMHMIHYVPRTYHSNQSILNDDRGIKYATISSYIFMKT